VRAELLLCYVPQRAPGCDLRLQPVPLHSLHQPVPLHPPAKADAEAAASSAAPGAAAPACPEANADAGADPEDDHEHHDHDYRRVSQGRGTHAVWCHRSGGERDGGTVAGQRRRAMLVLLRAGEPAATSSAARPEGAAARPARTDAEIHDEKV